MDDPISQSPNDQKTHIEINEEKMNKRKYIRPYNKKDAFLLAVCALLGFLLCECILFEGLGLSVPIYWLLFYICVFLYLKQKGHRYPKGSLVLLLPIAVLTLFFVLYDNQLLRIFNALLLMGLTALQLSAMAGVRLYKLYSPGAILDILYVWVDLPFRYISTAVNMVTGKASTSKRKNVWHVIIGIIYALPLLIVIGTLLSHADWAFEQVVGDIGRLFSQYFSEYTIKILVGLVIGVGIFSLLYGLKHRSRNNAYHINMTAEKVRFANPIIMSTVITLVCLLYLLYVVVQGEYFLSALIHGQLPEGFTYSGYARRGFFELQGVVVVNLLLYVLAVPFSKATQGKARKWLKMCETLLLLFTLFLIATAMAKMGLYMHDCTLTLLRLYTTWFMILLAVLFITLLIKVYRKGIPVFKVLSIAFVILYLGLNFLNVDHFIAKYNIDKHFEQPTVYLEMNAFLQLSSSATPELIRLLKSPQKEIISKVDVQLRERQMQEKPISWQTLNLSDISARWALAQEGYSLKK